MRHETTLPGGIKLVTHDFMPPGFAAMQNGEPWPDTHTVLLTPSGKVIDLGRPRDLFFYPRWEFKPMAEVEFRANMYGEFPPVEHPRG